MADQASVVGVDLTEASNATDLDRTEVVLPVRIVVGIEAIEAPDGKQHGDAVGFRQRGDAGRLEYPPSGEAAPKGIVEGPHGLAARGCCGRSRSRGLSQGGAQASPPLVAVPGCSNARSLRWRLNSGSMGQSRHAKTK